MRRSVQQIAAGEHPLDVHVQSGGETNSVLLGSRNATRNSAGYLCRSIITPHPPEGASKLIYQHNKTRPAATQCERVWGMVGKARTSRELVLPTMFVSYSKCSRSSDQAFEKVGRYMVLVVFVCHLTPRTLQLSTYSKQSCHHQTTSGTPTRMFSNIDTGFWMPYQLSFRLQGER